MDKGDDVYLRFWNFSWAFDIVNQMIIFANLAALGASLQAVGSIQSFLENRSFPVRIDDVVSEEAAVLGGAPQKHCHWLATNGCFG